MELNLKRPLIVFDLETTGLDLVNDRIIQISYIKVFPDGKEDRENLFVNPQKPIPQEVQALTHIAQSDVEGAPTFKELAPRLAETFRGCDFCGFNSNKFDVPMLSEEFSRAQVPFDFSESLLVDAQNIFHKMERRNLAAAYKFYTGHKMEDDFQSHRADQDAEATLRVLKGSWTCMLPGCRTRPTVCSTRHQGTGRVFEDERQCRFCWPHHLEGVYRRRGQGLPTRGVQLRPASWRSRRRRGAQRSGLHLLDALPRLHLRYEERGQPHSPARGLQNK